MKSIASSIVDNLKQVLGVIVSTIVIVGAMSGYLSTFASASDLEALKVQHANDFKTIEKKIDTNENRRQADQLQALSESYTDKLMEISLQPASPQKTVIIDHYKRKKHDTEIRLSDYR